MRKELEALLERYWDLAYLEGKSGISQGDKANEVLFALRKLAEQPAQQEPVAWGKPLDEMVQAATDEYDEWANDNKGTTECIRAMLVKALAATPQPAQRKPPQFPTMLRKMWSGSEVQKWINENWEQK